MTTDITIPDPNTTSLPIPTDLTYDDWTRLAAQVLAAREHADWWVGDLIAHAEDHYANGGTDTAAMANIFATLVDITTLSPNELWAARDVARRYPPKTRRRKVSWRHHARIADADPQLTDQLLDVAEREGWTVEELEAERRRWGAVDTTTTTTDDDSGDGEPAAMVARATIRITTPPGADPKILTAVVDRLTHALGQHLAQELDVDVDAVAVKASIQTKRAT